MTAPRSERLEAADGVSLHCRCWEAESPRAALLVVHGMFEHSRRYQELGEFMADAGVSTLGLDLRGHGASGGPRGHVRAFEAFLDDVVRFVGHAGRRFGPDVPRFLLGHSMGGLIGIRYLQRHDAPVCGAVITSPWLALANEVPGWQRVTARVLNRVFPRFPFPSDLDAADLSHDPERVADYRSDPEIFSTITPRLWLEVSAAGDVAMAEAGGIGVPMLLLLAGDDRIVDTQHALRFAEAASRSGDVTTRVLDGHFHEVLQETGRRAVLEEILEWLNGRIP